MVLSELGGVASVSESAVASSKPLLSRIVPRRTPQLLAELGGTVDAFEITLAGVACVPPINGPLLAVAAPNKR